MSTTRKWYAIYTKPRWEKKVHSLLQEKGIESYCPLNKERRKWSDRYKVVEEPLFKSYVFVKCNEEEKTPVRMVGGVVNFVYWLGKPAIIKDKEIEIIKRFLDEHSNIEVNQRAITPKTNVQIKSGALMDKEGVVLRVLKNRVEVVIDSIGYSLVAYVDKSKIAVID